MAPKFLLFSLLVSFFFLSVHSQCTYDVDRDGICDESDNCPFVSNPKQQDSNGDGIGDFCSISKVVSIFPLAFSTFPTGTLVTGIASALSVPISRLSVFIFSENSGAATRTEVRIFQTGTTLDSLPHVNSLMTLLTSQALKVANTSPSMGPYLVTVADKTAPSNCNRAGCQYTLPVINPCQRVWILTNTLSFPVNYSASTDSEKFVTGQLAAGEVKHFVYSGPPDTLELNLTHPRANSTLHPVTPQYFVDSLGDGNRCLVITPVCRNVFKISNPTTYRFDYQWSSLSNANKGIGSLAPGASDLIYTSSNLRGEKVQVDLTVRTEFKRKEGVALGRWKVCT